MTREEIRGSFLLSATILFTLDDHLLFLLSVTFKDHLSFFSFNEHLAILFCSQYHFIQAVASAASRAEAVVHNIIRRVCIWNCFS